MFQLEAALRSAPGSQRVRSAFNSLRAYALRAGYLDCTVRPVVGDMHNSENHYD